MPLVRYRMYEKANNITRPQRAMLMKAPATGTLHPPNECRSK